MRSFVHLFIYFSIFAFGWLCIDKIFSINLPTFNPFDDVYNVQRWLIERDEKVYIDFHECGYLGLQKDLNEYTKMYYQVFLNESTIHSKGFSTVLDTLCNSCLNNKEPIDKYWNKGNKDCRRKKENGDFNILEIDTSLIAKRLKVFNINLDRSTFEIDSLNQIKFIDLKDSSQKIHEFRFEIDENCILILHGQWFNPNPKRNFKDWIDEKWFEYKNRKDEPVEIFYDYDG